MEEKGEKAITMQPPEVVMGLVVLCWVCVWAEVGSEVNALMML